MKIFEMRDGNVYPTEEILNVFPFDEIWQRDTHRSKDLALREFAYIEFMCSPKESNVFYGYPQSAEDNTRSRKIIENKFSKEYPEWTPNELVNIAIEQYKEFYYNASATMSFFESNVIAANKIDKFYRTFDMNERNERTNAPIFKAKEITDSIKNAEEVMTKLVTLREKVNQEIFEKSKTKGNKNINHFER